MKRPTKRRILPVAVACLLTCAQASLLDSPPPQTAVNDYAQAMTPQTRAMLEQVSQRLMATTGVALVIVTMQSLEGESIDDFANRLYERWGIGKKETDEGVLVLVALKERLARIEVGYGSEGYLPDAHADRIRREVFNPPASRGEWDKAFAQTAATVTGLVARAKGVSTESILRGSGYQSQRQSPPRPNPLGVVVLIIAIILLLGTRTGRAMLPWILLGMLASGRRGGYSRGGGFGGGFGGGGFGGGMSGGGGSSGRF